MYISTVESFLGWLYVCFRVLFPNFALSSRPGWGRFERFKTVIRMEHWIVSHSNKSFLSIALSRIQQQTLPPTATNAKTVPSTPVITTATPCSSKEFQCNDGSCIRKAYRCDGTFDCLDNSDEEKCPCKSFQMTCANGVCVNKLWICDGADDCGDGSDEKNCDAPTAPSCKTLSFLLS